MLQDYPFIREIEPPLTEHMLRPLDPRCEWVQFSSALADDDYRALGSWLAQYPDVALRAYGSYDGSITDLRFLRFFPRLRRFQADALYDSLRNIDGLEYLPDDMHTIEIGETRKRLSLAPLERFRQLRRLYLEGHTKDFDVVSD